MIALAKDAEPVPADEEASDCPSSVSAFPTPYAYVRLAANLDRLGYPVGPRGEIVRHVMTHRTAECAPHLSEEHRRVIERTLDVDPNWNDGRWDAITPEVVDINREV